MRTFLDRLNFLIEKEEGGKHTVFAKNAGIKAGTFQNYINGRKPNFDALLNICERYKVNLTWLVAGVGTPYIEVKEANEPNKEKTKKREKPTKEFLLLVDKWLVELTSTDPGRDEWFKYNFIDAFPKFENWMRSRETEKENRKVA